MAIFLRPVFPASRVQHISISDLHSKFALGPQHVWKYGAPICGPNLRPLRLCDEKKKKKKQTTAQKYNGLQYYIRRP